MRRFSARARAGRFVLFTLVAVLVPGAATAEPTPLSDVVIARDAAGRPITPDLDEARSRTGRPRSGNDLSFTYDSPSQPWTSEELATLTTAIADFYPVIKQVYGDPAYSITVNVRKDTANFAVGSYNPSANELVLRGTYDLSVLCHEIIHAFRDDSIVLMPSYEEGMTRAAEVEVFARLAAYVHSFDERHSYGYDVYYEGLNRPEIGSANGQFFSGYVAPLVRYQLGGYAWAKALLETPAFFIDFNAALYAAMLADPSTASDEADLIAMAAAAAPTVEGEPFADWYASQAVLDTTPPQGWFLYQRINQFTIDFFQRGASNYESMQPAATIDWEVYDYAGTLLDSGTDVTSGLGLMSFSPDLPPAYTGRIRVVAHATSPDGPVTSSAVRQAGAAQGVFGVVTGADAGSVVITPVDDPGSAVTVPVVDGAFYAPTLETLAGKFTAEFSGTPAGSLSRTFTKDASPYFLILALPECGNGNLDPGEECDDGDADDGDGCDTNCTATACANGIRTGNEHCDDGNGASGDGCSSSCESELVPGGTKANECAHEWLVVPTPATDDNGYPASAITCTDGDACDAGASGDGECTFSVALCLNVDEQRFSCTPSDIERLAIARPRQDAPRDAVDTANRDALEAALAAAGGIVSGECKRPSSLRGALCSVDADCDSAPASGDGDCVGRFVAFDPALAQTTVCSSVAAITVPARGDGESGKRMLMVRADGSPGPDGKRPKPDKDKLALSCLP